MNPVLISLLALGVPLVAWCRIALSDEEMKRLHDAADLNALNALPYLGRIAPRAASQIGGSTWSVGGETLDRDFALYANYRRFLGPLGAKAIRLQAGWAKCEKERGVYDWAWLDEVVDDALAQGVQPWLETSYGNPLYPGGGDAGLGGGFPKAPEALVAWDNWVQALVRRYRDRVFEWEIWNEPDLAESHTPRMYADLFVRTASIIRDEQPQAKIYALALCHSVEFGVKFIENLQRRGQLDLVDAVTVHGYPNNPDNTSLADGVSAWLRKHAPGIGVRQGETGAPSTSATFGALSGLAWTELTQAKWNLRRMLAHHGRGYPFSLFTLMELHYPGRVNTKGLLKANPDMTVAYAKPAYFAAQHVFAVFDDSLERVPDPRVVSSVTNQLAVYAYRQKVTGRPIIALWFSGQPPEDSNATTRVDLRFPGVGFHEPIYADLLTGQVYEIPPTRWSGDGDVASFTQLPVYDSPILIADRSTLPLTEEIVQPVWETSP